MKYLTVHPAYSVRLLVRRSRVKKAVIGGQNPFMDFLALYPSVLSKAEGLHQKQLGRVPSLLDWAANNQ